MKDKPILIVEDEPMLREAFRLMLEGSGYIIHEAGTGAEALAAVATHKPALVLLDLGLPDMSGLDVARTIKSDPASERTIVIALTGRVGAAEKQECLDAGCQEYYPKPLSPREFLRRLPELLR
jgi:two-component system, OmpR family, KDP operon response regulator KdpE